MLQMKTLNLQNEQNLMSAIEINHINIRASLDLIVSLRDFYCDALQVQVG